MRHLSIAFAVVLALTACREVQPQSTPPAPSAAPLSTTQARALPPEALKARVLAQLSDVLILAPAEDRPVLTRLNFRTRPRATEAKRLCQSDRVVIPLQPDRPVDLPKTHTPMRAVGMRTTPTFHLIRDKSERCDQLDPFTAPFVIADNLGRANMGALVIEAVAARAAAPASRLDVDCDTLPDCRSWLAALSFNAVSRVETCSGESTLPSCLRFEIAHEAMLDVTYSIGREGLSVGPVRVMQVARMDDEAARQD